MEEPKSAGLYALKGALYGVVLLFILGFTCFFKETENVYSMPVSKMLYCVLGYGTMANIFYGLIVIPFSALVGFLVAKVINERLSHEDEED